MKNNDLNEFWNKMFGIDLDINNKSDENESISKKGSDTVKNSTYTGYKAENIIEDYQKIGVKLEYAVPGIKKNQIHVSATSNFIYVSCDEEVPFFGKLDMKVKIGFEVFPKNIKCTCVDGFLTISIYKEIVKEEKNIIDIE